MRENRTYGSEGGEAQAFPTPIQALPAATMIEVPNERNSRTARSMSYQACKLIARAVPLPFSWGIREIDKM